MRPQPFEIKELRRQHERLKAYMMQSFKDNKMDNVIMQIVVAYIFACCVMLAASLLSVVLK